MSEKVQIWSTVSLYSEGIRSFLMNPDHMCNHSQVEMMFQSKAWHKTYEDAFQQATSEIAKRITEYLEKITELMNIDLSDKSTIISEPQSSPS